ncbi:hypothetical protein CSOJ01_10996 [Colletotrichum sojae]|uniref:Ricin B lectin domain-containing protein n=1 Tax=Colletotrichum sojae TaxID=2175907 RepID=A0A8H6IZE3_9PEZI|nr:hypothetical protein CSOJ01_10996 [Colletotrichum sojae]
MYAYKFQPLRQTTDPTRQEMHSETSSTTCTADTPPPSEAFMDLDGSEVPWSGKAYLILQKGTSKEITLDDTGTDGGGSLRMKSVHLAEGKAGNNHWFCVERDGFFGFQNPASGTYIGHDGKDAIRAAASHLKAWEMFTPREHPSGGYQLRTPYSQQVLMVLCVAGDGTSLVRGSHGITRWEFVPVTL